MKKARITPFLSYVLHRKAWDGPQTRPLARKHHHTAQRQARRYAASNRCDPFAYARKVLHLKGGLDNLLFE